MNVDAVCLTGRSHLVCQDYALAHQVADLDTGAERCLLVACDGCSSSPHTDFGSRFLAHTTANWIADHRPFLDEGGLLPGRELVQRAQMPVGQLKMHPDCLDATMLVAYDWGPVLRVLVSGDGLVAARRHDGGIESWRFQMPSGAPSYLNYLVSPSRLATYQQQFGGGERILTYLGPDGEYTESRLFDAESPFWVLDLDPAQYTLVLLCTDGIESFTRQEGRGKPTTLVPYTDVLPHLLKVAPPAMGPFMARRMMRFTREECHNLGWSHYDDFSAAAVWLGGGA